MNQDENVKKVHNFKKYLHESIKGQDEAIQDVFDIFSTGELDLREAGKPRGSFIFMGPTGVGKTEITKLASKYFFDEDPIKINMPEFSRPENITKLIGDHTGKLGQLGDAIVKRSEEKGGVILFDEMEKAHPTIVDICLSMLDEAEVTCGPSRLLNLRNFYLVFTSNVGSHKILSLKKTNDKDLLLQVIRGEFIRRGYRPEFLARFDKLVIFDFIKARVAREIALLNLHNESARFAQKANIDKITWTNDIINAACLNGYNRDGGVRPMRRYIQANLFEEAYKRLVFSDKDFHGHMELRLCDETNLPFLEPFGSEVKLLQPN